VTPDDRRHAIAARIADGSGVDWATTDAGVADGDSDERGVLDQLKAIAALAALHRAPEERADEGPSLAGKRWGALTLIAPIGEGRFGHVYRAWDARLQRQVALKILYAASPSAAASPTRAIEEARLLARVRHPNVLAVYGAECIDEQVGIWTEFIEGRTLESYLSTRGPLPADEVVAIGLDLCRALGAVHEAGLLHRDVKAQNVMRETGGRIVLMDFGTGHDLDRRPTREGDLSGTPLYLAPELFAGGRPSVASDIYALAVLLFYLSTGRHPVPGRTLDDVRAAHRSRTRVALRDERADLPDVFVSLPAPFIAVLERALNPDPAQRFESASAFEAALAQAQTRDAAESRPGRWRPIAVTVGVVTAIGAVVAILLVINWPRPPIIPPTARQVQTPNGQLGQPSRDGRFYPWVEDGSGDVKIWEIGTGRSHTVAQHTSNSSGLGWERQVPSDDGVEPSYQYSPTAMSPNGDRVVYTWATGQDTFELRLVNADGTLDRTLFEPRSAFEPYPVAWSADGRQILCWLLNKDGTADLVLVSAEDGSRHLLATKKTTGIPGTTLASDGRSVIFERPSSAGPHELVRVTLDNPTPTLVFPKPGGDYSPIWVDATHLFFIRVSQRLKDSMDAYIVRGLAGEVRGEPSMVIENISVDTDFVVTGQTSVQNHSLQHWNEVYTATLDPTGHTPPSVPVRIAPTEIGGHWAASWSPDGSLIGFFRVTPFQGVGIQDSRFLVIKDVATGVIRTLHPKLQLDRYLPRWSPDGKSVRVYGTDDLVGETRIGWYEVNVATEASKPVVLDIAPLAQFLPDFQSVIYLDDPDEPSKGRGLVWRQLASGQERVIVPEGAESVGGRPEISPDGRFLAFLANQRVNGKTVHRLELQPLDGGPRRILLSSVEPDRISLHTWTPEGQHIIISRGHSKAMTASRESVWLLPVHGGSLVDMHFTVAPRAGFDMNRDGRRIVYAEPIQAEVLWTRPLPLEPQGPTHQKR
jgi:serine/threonine protein kinase/Tol biopolymer transport system component